MAMDSMTLDELTHALSSVMEEQRAAEAKQNALFNMRASLRPESKHQRMVKRDLEDELAELGEALRGMHKEKMNLIARIGAMSK
jgi:hypothetical protein